MQTLFLTGNLAADCEIVKGKDDAEFIRFTVATNEPGASKEDKPTYYNCRMKKTGVADFLKKGRFVALVGNLHIWENIKDGKSYVNHDVRVQTLDGPSLSGGE